MRPYSCSSQVMERLSKFVADSEWYNSSMSTGSLPRSAAMLSKMAFHFPSASPWGSTSEQAAMAPAFTSGVEGRSFSSRIAKMELNGSPVASAPMSSRIA